MSDKKSFSSEISENKAVVAGAATFVASGATGLGLSTGALGAVTVGKVGLILSSLGPVGLIAGGGLIVGGIIYTAVKRKKQ